ncbi:hypothetical protein DAPPUDRAFT_114694 [Daphnia pulex]|uniref:Uncharacterized protein n=1 Tax=Daphnia pulex TaxID=6669 RepID=E9HIZ3_DAPPU|nr:hypothetical protein DAPPUDRAFT_114694 [Daphnia pulex]|eukprot:EFX68301.1 hypothetical protein DAPPUDRAFT_114694 [Daphnia pulex]
MNVAEPYRPSSLPPDHQYQQHFIMALCYPSDEIMATAADRLAIAQRNGDRMTVGVDSPWIDIWRQCLSQLETRRRPSGHCVKEHGGRVNNLEEAASEKGL